MPRKNLFLVRSLIFYQRQYQLRYFYFYQYHYLVWNLYKKSSLVAFSGYNKSNFCFIAFFWVCACSSYCRQFFVKYCWKLSFTYTIPVINVLLTFLFCFLIKIQQETTRYFLIMLYFFNNLSFILQPNFHLTETH